MSDQLHQIFKVMREGEPAADLEQKIMNRIQFERHRQALRQAFVARTCLFSSAAIFVFALVHYGKSLLASDFWNVSSLLFSDAHVVINHWNDFVFSLLETLPVVHIIAFLLPLFALALSLNWYFNVNQRNHHIYL